MDATAAATAVKDEVEVKDEEEETSLVAALADAVENYDGSDDEECDQPVAPTLKQESIDDANQPWQPNHEVSAKQAELEQAPTKTTTEEQAKPHTETTKAAIATVQQAAVQQPSAETQPTAVATVPQPVSSAVPATAATLAAPELPKPKPMDNPKHIFNFFKNASSNFGDNEDFLSKMSQPPNHTASAKSMPDSAEYTPGGGFVLLSPQDSAVQQQHPNSTEQKQKEKKEKKDKKDKKQQKDKEQEEKQKKEKKHKKDKHIDDGKAKKGDDDEEKKHKKKNKETKKEADLPNSSQRKRKHDGQAAPARAIGGLGSDQGTDKRHASPTSDELEKIALKTLKSMARRSERATVKAKAALPAAATAAHEKATAKAKASPAAKSSFAKAKAAAAKARAQPKAKAKTKSAPASNRSSNTAKAKAKKADPKNDVN